MHAEGTPSDWLTRWANQLPRHGRALDVACGAGRHARWLCQHGLQVTAVDRDGQALQHLPATVKAVQADLEQGHWPLCSNGFDVVLVTNYLWRPLWPALLASVAPGGWLIYETFAHGQERLGRPSRPAFLLAPGELLGVCAAWRVHAYEDTTLAQPERRVQRIAAQRPPG